MGHSRMDGPKRNTKRAHTSSVKSAGMRRSVGSAAALTSMAVRKDAIGSRIISAQHARGKAADMGIRPPGFTEKELEHILMTDQLDKITGKCHFCGKELDGENWCFGCGHFVCDDCDDDELVMCNGDIEKHRGQHST